MAFINALWLCMIPQHSSIARCNQVGVDVDEEVKAEYLIYKP